VTRGLLILDFDGTLCVGESPVLAYAREVARALGEPAPSILEPLESFLAGEPSPLAAGSADGYSAVAAWARSRGLGDEDLGLAYHASRRELEAGELEVAAPEGIEAFLHSFESWERVLVTNAPRAGTEHILERLHLAHLVDRVVGDAGKPDGLRRFTASGAEGDLRARDHVLSIGDIWRNDLEPVAHGAATALIERHAQPEARPTFRAATIEALYDEIARWRTHLPTPA